ncbi:MAG: hypothetical protein EOO89_30600 [Pedobacter sp.]|nr:MAG: hypothetical protein EOO89_30600 [Pedobacter sp.]
MYLKQRIDGRKIESYESNRTILRLHKQGDSIKSIARNLWISKNTVKAYISKLAAGEIPLAELLGMEDPLLMGKFHVGSPAFKDPRFEYLRNHLTYCAKELESVGMTRRLLYEEYDL